MAARSCKYSRFQELRVSMLTKLRGYRRPLDMPDILIDEAETSLNASFQVVISPKDREDLIEDRLTEWLAYNEGRTTQVPTGRVVGVKGRVKRKIGYAGKYITFEYAT